MNLSWIDILIVAVPGVTVIAVALLMRRYLRSVADFLAASRCAGRYVICTAAGETGAFGLGFISWLEAFSRTGFSLGLWTSFTTFLTFLLTLTGFVVYRYRQTQSLTFHQFFETRYNRGVRVLASFLNVFSGLFSFGIAPAACARFFVCFLGMPAQVPVLGIPVPTFALLMLLFISVSLYVTLSGGQITVLVTDCIEGLISGVFYLVVSFAVLSLITHAQAAHVMLSGPPGQSFVNPFDIGKQPDFNIVYVVIGMLMQLYYFRGTAWHQGFAAAAKSPHESKMAGILGMWRIFAGGTMAGLVAIGAMVVLNHPDFSGKAAAVQHALAGISNPQLQTQMRMPLALGTLLPAGTKGAFLAIALFGLLAGQGAAMHNFGSTLVQDVILPFRTKPFDPKRHILWLRCAAVGVGVFALIFSLLYKPVDYLVMITALFSAIYLGGVGAVVLGGLYWKKGTTAGAYAALITGATLAIVGQILQQAWTWLAPHLARLAGPGAIAGYLAAHAARCPLNGQLLAFLSIVGAASAYILVSLLTCRQNYDLDRLLHRGKYAPASTAAVPPTPAQPIARLARFIGIDDQYTLGDKWIAGGIFCWTTFWKIVAIVILVWNVFFWRWTAAWWFNYQWAVAICLPLAISVFTTTWFSIGGIRDLARLFKALHAAKADPTDDGRVARE